MTRSAMNQLKMDTHKQSLPVEPSEKRQFWLVFAALTLLYLLAIAIGNRRYVWYDELFTFDIAGSPSLQQLWSRELRFDNHTPTIYLLSRYSMAIFGPTPLGLRFPSMVEFYFGSIAILVYVRRKADIAFATLAVLLLWAVAPTLFYAVEARPYALEFLAFSCLLLSWDTATRVEPRRLALFGIAASTLALAVAHMFAVFTLFPFFIAEAVRFLRRRKPDYQLWAALLVPMLSMLIYIPLIRASESIVFGIHPSFHTIIFFFEDTLGSPILSVVLLTLLVIPAPSDGRTTAIRFENEEIALLAGMFLSPILLNLVLMYRQGTFYNRYCLASQVAILVALAILLPYRMRLNRWAAYAGSILLLLFILDKQIFHLLRFPVPGNAAFLGSIHPDLPLVAAEGQVFAEMNHYENAALLSRLYFLRDPQAALQLAHTNFFQVFEAPDDMKRAGFPYTGNIAPYSDFVRRHRQFLLLSSPGRWVFAKLLSSGASIAVVGDYKGAMPYVDTTLYLVTMPSQ
jgi:hypothetical protein